MGVTVSAAERALMWRHFGLVIGGNRRFNLTRITSPAESAVKHYGDALALLACPGVEPAEPMAILDVGTGAGFPAVPLAIVGRAWRITAIDGTGKKARFVAECAAELALTNLAARHIRAAELAREEGPRFDRVLLRAVGRLDRGLREVHRLVGPAGEVIFYKTAALEAEELRRAEKVAASVGLQPAGVVEVTLPLGEEPVERKLVRFGRNAS